MMLKQVSYGGGCIVQCTSAATSHMPFGESVEQQWNGWLSPERTTLALHARHHEEIGTSGYSNPVCTVQEQIEYIKERN